jgi:hypothetical protein
MPGAWVAGMRPVCRVAGRRPSATSEGEAVDYAAVGGDRPGLEAVAPDDDVDEVGV